MQDKRLVTIDHL